MERSNHGTRRMGSWVLTTLGAIALAGVALATSGNERVQAQQRDDTPQRFFVGGGFTFSNPVGEFALAVEDGWGVDGHGRVALDPQGTLSLRVSAGFIEYGRESKRVCISLTVGCRVTTDLVTTNNIFYFELGPELGFQMGRVRPYTSVALGFGYFSTTSSLQDFDDFDYDNDVFETTNFDDGTFAWSSRSGLQVRVTTGRHPVFLDFGAVYHDNGLVDYLTKGDIQDNTDGSISIFPTTSEANLWSFVFGVTVGLGAAHDS